MIEMIVKSVVKTVANLLGKKINSKVSDKQSLADADLSKDFEYTMKNVKFFLISGITILLIGIGLTIVMVFEFTKVNELNSDLIAGGSIGLLSFVFGIGVIVNYLKYEIRYTNSYITKQSIMKTQELRWDAITGIAVNKKNMIVLKTDAEELTIKPVVTGIHDLIYLLINTYGEDVVTVLSQNQLTYKKLNETIKKNQANKEQAA